MGALHDGLHDAGLMWRDGYMMGAIGAMGSMI
jgi:hypothetical protein